HALHAVALLDHVGVLVLEQFVAHRLREQRPAEDEGLGHVAPHQRGFVLGQQPVLGGVVQQRHVALVRQQLVGGEIRAGDLAGEDAAQQLQRRARFLAQVAEGRQVHAAAAMEGAFVGHLQLVERGVEADIAVDRRLAHRRGDVLLQEAAVHAGIEARAHLDQDVDPGAARDLGRRFDQELEERHRRVAAGHR
ncbi:hypothetical protein CATMIT_01639, partial [Catenibacterium mitsuokai DSM 15897]